MKQIPIRDLRPPGSPVIPGYNHLDVVTAAPEQNNGQPEGVATFLLDFLFQPQLIFGEATSTEGAVT